MFEARLEQAELLKKILDAVKELVTDANFDCSDEGLKLQAMDNSHVALVSLFLMAPGFREYRCDRDMSLGMSLASLTKIIKCAANNDVITMRADESHDVLALLFESPNKDRIGEYEMKLMDIDQEHLGIPETVYDAEIELPAAEFARIIRDLKELGESVKIEVSKDGVRFSAEGDIGQASITLKQQGNESRNIEEDDEDEEEEDEEDEDEEEQDEEEEEAEEAVKDEDEAMAEVEDEKPVVNGDKEASGEPAETQDEKPDIVTIEDDEEDDEDEEQVTSVKDKIKKEKAKKEQVKKEKAKKEKAAAKKVKAEKKRKAPTKAKAGKGKKAKGDKTEKEDATKVTITMQQAVALTFSIKYLSNFAKSTPLSTYVKLHMSNEVPLLVEYPFDQGHIRYYLAPKIADDE